MKDITFAELQSIWWAFFWRSAVFGLLIGFILGVIGGATIAVLGHPEWATIIGSAIGFISSIPATMLALRLALRKKYHTFELTMLRF